MRIQATLLLLNVNHFDKMDSIWQNFYWLWISSCPIPNTVEPRFFFKENKMRGPFSISSQSLREIIYLLNCASRFNLSKISVKSVACAWCADKAKTDLCNTNYYKLKNISRSLLFFFINNYNLMILMHSQISFNETSTVIIQNIALEAFSKINKPNI